MRTYSTLDLAVTNTCDLMALIHVCGRLIKKQDNGEFLHLIRNIKFKMKLAYECWHKNLRLSELFKEAISKTLVEQTAISIYKLQRYIAKSEEYKEIERNELKNEIIDRKKREKLALHYKELDRGMLFQDTRELISKNR